MTPLRADVIPQRVVVDPVDGNPIVLGSMNLNMLGSSPRSELPYLKALDAASGSQLCEATLSAEQKYDRQGQLASSTALQ